MYRANEIANFFIQLANELPGDSIDNLKLNKLLFFTQGQSLSKLGRKMFSDDIEAWDYGPVVSDVYRSYKVCGRNPIEQSLEYFDESVLDNDELSILVDVYTNYGKYSSGTLVSMTHQQNTPWTKFYKEGHNVIIPEQAIKEYFDNDTFYKPFEIDYSKADVVTAIPLEWDSQEDSAYD